MPSSNDAPPVAADPLGLKRYHQFFSALVLGLLIIWGVQSRPWDVAPFEETIWGRAGLISIFTRLRLAVGDRVFAQVFVGQRGWLDYQNSLDDYQNFPNRPQLHLEVLQTRLAALNARLAARGTRLVIVVAPEKDTVYPQMLPPEIAKNLGPTRLDTLLMYLSQKPGSPLVIDLRAALQRAALQPAPAPALYYQTDSHWNAYGAYAGYAEIVKQLSTPNLQLIPRPLESFPIGVESPQPKDLARLLGADFWTEPTIDAGFPLDIGHDYTAATANYHYSITRAWQAGPQLPALVMYHDSFGAGFIPYLSTHFSQSVYIFNADVDLIEPVDLSWVDRYQPQIVIIEIVGRNLQALEKLLPPE